MSIIQMGKLTLGAGKPKICVPIVEPTAESIMQEAIDLVNNYADEIDLIEWRADWFENVSDWDAVKTMLEQLDVVLNGIPLLYTFRTKREGGERDITPESYIQMLERAVKSNLVQAVDVEAFFLEKLKIRQIVAKANQCNCIIIGSNHDFDKTPEADELKRRLYYMKETGVHLPKLAVMPRSKSDVLTLLGVTADMEQEFPIVTMSMGSSGLISRLTGEIFSSSITFAAAKKTSASGQMHIKEVRKILDIIHNNLNAE